MAGILANLLQMSAQPTAQGIQGFMTGTDKKRQAELDEQKRIREEMFRQAALELQKRQQGLAEKREDRLSQPEQPTYRAGAGGVSAEFPTEDAARDFVNRNTPEPSTAPKTPTESRLGRQERLRRAEAMVDNLIAAGHPTYVIDQELQKAGLGGVISGSEIHGRFRAALEDEQREGLIDANRRSVMAARSGRNQPSGPTQVGGVTFDAGGGSPLPPSRKDAMAAQTTAREPLTPQEVAEARALGATEADLKAAGYTPEEIRQILGGG